MSHSLALSSPDPADERRVDAVSIAQVGQAVRRRWRWVALPAVLAFGASALFVNLVTPRYTGEAKLILETRDSFYTRPTQDRADQAPQIDEQAVASQVQVVMSRDLALDAIRRLGLVGNPEFDPAVDGPGLKQQILTALGLAADPLTRPPEERVLEKYYDRLLVYPVGKSRILAIEFRSRDAELAARAANTIAEMYLNGQEASKKEMARSASNWLGSNIDILRGRLAEAESKVEAFRAKTGLLLGTNNAPVSGQQLTDLTTQLTQARTSQADAQAKAALIRDAIRDGRTFEIPDVANNELIRRLIEQRINLRTQLALELRTLGNQHPRIKELQAQLADLEAQVRGSAERVVRTLENEARIAGSRVESLQAALDAQKKAVVTSNESEPQLRALEREARAQREQLEAYLTRYREAMARDAENAAPADARIVSRAVVAALPSFPKKLPIVALATIATIVLAVGAIIARELLTGGPAAPRMMPGETLFADDERSAERLRAADTQVALARALGVDPEPQRPAAVIAAERTAAGEPASASPLGHPAHELSKAVPPVQPAAELASDAAMVENRPGETLLEPQAVETTFGPRNATIDSPVAEHETPAALEPAAAERGVADPIASDLAFVAADRSDPAPTTDSADILSEAGADGGPDRSTASQAALAVPDQHPSEAAEPAAALLAAPALAEGMGEAGDAERYDFEPLIARLQASPVEGRGRRVLVTGVGRSESALVMGVDLGHRLAGQGRALFVIVDPEAGGFVDAPLGFTDLIAGEASFADAINPDAESGLHVVSAGLVEGGVLVDEPQSVDIALSAFEQTYDWIVCGLCDSRNPVLLEMFAQRVDAVVIASDESGEDPALVELYARAKTAGAGDVVVAREMASIEAHA